MLVDQDDERARNVSRVLSRAGCEVVARVADPAALEPTMDACQPDLVIIEHGSPTRDVLEGMRHLGTPDRRPVVLFVDEAGIDLMREAVRAGVSAYVVDGLEADRVRPLLDLAIARFEEHQRLRGELDRTQQRLRDRQLIERAKGRVMERFSMTEDAAYAAMRRLAMDQNVRLPDLARRILDEA